MSYNKDKNSFGDRRNRRFNEPREMHPVTCSDCGINTEVPFKPDNERPVYCKDCYRKNRPPRRY